MGRPKKSPCDGCVYWRSIVNSGYRGTDGRCCHFLLDTGISRFAMGAWGKCTVKRERNRERE